VFEVRPCRDLTFAHVRAYALLSPLVAPCDAFAARPRRTVSFGWLLAVASLCRTSASGRLLLVGGARSPGKAEAATCSIARFEGLALMLRLRRQLLKLTAERAESAFQIRRDERAGTAQLTGNARRRLGLCAG
jgi:hypothetical protein